MNKISLLTIIIEGIGAITGIGGFIRAYPEDIFTAILFAVFAVCCILLGSLTIKTRR